MPRFRWFVATLAAALLVGCSKEERREPAQTAGPNPAATPAPVKPKVEGAGPFAAGDVAHGKKLVEEFECSRCHDGTGALSAPPEKHCVRCHQDILSGKFKAPAAALAKWRPNVARLRDVPSLVSVGKRLRPEWIARFILEPHDLRPNLVQNMPRLKLTKEQARDIASYLTDGQRTPAGGPSVDAGDAATGRELFESKGCGTCHLFGGVGALATTPKLNEGSDDQKRAVTLAPDLRFARDRVRRDRIVEWILDPKAVKPDTLMTPSPLSAREAKSIAAFILTADLEELKPPAVPERLAVLKRKVSFDEVNEKVFMRTCRHCHGDADALLGDGGPGNTGGFGFKPRGVNFSHLRGVMSGRINDAGERESLFAPLQDGTPRLVAALLSRHSEQAGRPNAEVRGMPLSLPALPAEDIQLVESWIAQGRRP